MQLLLGGGLGGIAYRTGIPAPLYRHTRPPFYRHSRVSGNLAADGRQRAGLFNTVRDSRLRGNDGRGAAAAPLCHSERSRGI